MEQAGWYRDEQRPELARWHDGEGWTEHTLVIADQTPGVAPPPPTPAPPVDASPPDVAPAAPAAASVPSPPSPSAPPTPASPVDPIPSVRPSMPASARSDPNPHHRDGTGQPWFKNKGLLIVLALAALALRRGDRRRSKG